MIGNFAYYRLSMSEGEGDSTRSSARSSVIIFRRRSASSEQCGPKLLASVSLSTTLVNNSLAK